MKAIKYLLLLLVTVVSFSSCVVREPVIREHRSYWVPGHYEYGPYHSRYWVRGYYS